jgi:hypothetical protein
MALSRLASDQSNFSARALFASIFTTELAYRLCRCFRPLTAFINFVHSYISQKDRVWWLRQADRFPATGQASDYAVKDQTERQAENRKK